MSTKGEFSDFGELVAVATEGHAPYAYQVRLAEEGLPDLLDVPTGAGKTLAAVLSWLWRSYRHPDQTPRRLVYVLPLRTLVEQTAKQVAGWLRNLGWLWTPDGVAGSGDGGEDNRVVLHVLMGGAERDDDRWQLDPGRRVILIGTQDMILSRALMRGYAEARSRWPISFALLHSDAQWVFDETQLLGPALPTGAQLQGLRDALGTAATTRTMWMSATLDRNGLATVDHPADSLRVVELSDEDRAEPLRKRLDATRTVRRLALPTDGKAYPAAVAAVLINRHTPGSRTIAVLNTVERATAVFKAIRRKGPEADAVLVHSRFRPYERRKLIEDKVVADPPDLGRYVVSTQVLEAGVDISARTLFTELAPWSSIVQRAGRCNRTGDDDPASLLWAPPPSGRNAAAPYEEEDLAGAAEALDELEGRAVTSTDLQRREVKQSTPLYPVLRRRDLLQLFDTTPDLTGSDIDVSPWIRDGDDTGVWVLWRDFSANGGPAADEPQPHRDELCPAPIGDVKKWAGEDGRRRLWLRDRIDGTWRRATPGDVVPGAVLFADAAAGGYDPELGWAPDSRAPVPPVPLPPSETRKPANDALGSDDLSFDSGWVGLARHLSDVEEEVRRLTPGRGLPGLTAAQLSAAAFAGRYHDLGKAHPVFQETLRKSGENPPDGVLAKSPKETGPRHRRPYFRHELVSALMLLHPESRLLDEAVARGELAEEERDLVVYLVAAHHGKVRLAARSVRDEALHEPPRLLGVEDNDRTLAVELSPRERLDALELDISPFRVGAFDGESWTARALRLRDRPDLGPFRLAYLEALVRIADMRVSRSYRAKEAR